MLAVELLQCNRNKDQGSVLSAMKKVYTKYCSQYIYIIITGCVHAKPLYMSSLYVQSCMVSLGVMWFQGLCGSRGHVVLLNGNRLNIFT